MLVYIIFDLYPFLVALNEVLKVLLRAEWAVDEITEVVSVWIDVEVLVGLWFLLEVGLVQDFHLFVLALARILWHRNDQVEDLLPDLSSHRLAEVVWCIPWHTNHPDLARVCHDSKLRPREQILDDADLPLSLLLQPVLLQLLMAFLLALSLLAGASPSLLFVIEQFRVDSGKTHLMQQLVLFLELVHERFTPRDKGGLPRGSRQQACVHSLGASIRSY